MFGRAVCAGGGKVTHKVCVSVLGAACDTHLAWDGEMIVLTDQSG